MKKHFSAARLTAMLLVFCVTAALLCVPAFADTTDPVTVSATADGETAAVTYEGNVNVTADNTAAVEADAAGTAPNSSVTASIEGNVSVTGDNSAAVQVQTLGNFSEVTVDINGDVSASGEDSAAIAVKRICSLCWVSRVMKTQKQLSRQDSVNLKNVLQIK